MTKFRDLHKGWMESDPDYRESYESLAGEFALAGAIIEARKQAGLTQEQLAERMGVTQPHIARLEGGKNPSINTLERIASATGSKLKISFEPQAC